MEAITEEGEGNDVATSGAIKPAARKTSDSSRETYERHGGSTLMPALNWIEIPS